MNLSSLKAKSHFGGAINTSKVSITQRPKKGGLMALRFSFCEDLRKTLPVGEKFDVNFNELTGTVTVFHSSKGWRLTSPESSNRSYLTIGLPKNFKLLPGESFSTSIIQVKPGFLSFSLEDAL